MTKRELIRLSNQVHREVVAFIKRKRKQEAKGKRRKPLIFK